MRVSPIVAVAVGGLVVGLAAPAAASEASHLISGSQIKNHTVTGKKLKNNTVTGKQVKESTLGIVPEAKKLPPLRWHNVTAFRNGWANLPNFGKAGYALDAQGVIHLRGVIGGGTSDTEAFVIPGTHISGSIILPAQANEGVGVLKIESDGSVIPTNQQDDSEDVNGGVALDGVTFAANNGPATTPTSVNRGEHPGVFSSR
jgi:hypothetical protein